MHLIKKCEEFLANLFDSLVDLWSILLMHRLSLIILGVSFIYITVSLSSYVYVVVLYFISTSFDAYCVIFLLVYASCSFFVNGLLCCFFVIWQPRLVKGQVLGFFPYRSIRYIKDFVHCWIPISRFCWVSKHNLGIPIWDAVRISHWNSW